MNETKKIQSLKHLESLLKDCQSGDDYIKLLRSLKMEVDEFLPLTEWDSHTYKKIKLFDEKDYDLYLICWEAGQETKIHDHNGTQSFVYVLSGELEEIVYRKKLGSDGIEIKSAEILEQRNYAYINDSAGIHRLINNPISRTISLHLFVPPVKKYNVYSSTGNIIEQVVN